MNNGLSRFELNPQGGMQPSRFTSKSAFTSEDKKEVNHFYFNPMVTASSPVCGSVPRVGRISRLIR